MEKHVSTISLVDRVVNALRARIVQGEFRPGQYLPSRRELASEFGVGLSTIHEAVQALSVLGIVEARSGKGTWVREDVLHTLVPLSVVKARLSDLDAPHVLEARAVFEVALSNLAAERCNSDDCERLHAALLCMEERLGDDQAFVEADLEFHMAVASAAHNPLLEKMYYLVRNLLAEVISEFVKLPGSKEEAIKLQTSIYQAIKAGDPEKARVATLMHIRSVEKTIEGLE